MAPDPEFVHDWPASRVVFGTGSIGLVAQETARLGHRPLLINDPAAESYADTIAAQYKDGIAARIGEVVMHVPTPAARAAAERARQADADVVVCVGGGSATGLAKGVAKFTGLPILAVPTTYAGSEMTSIWGLTDDGRKVTGRDDIVRPRTVIYDPALTLSLPVPISVTSAMNAIAHSVEALYSPMASPIALLAAEEGIRALAGALPLLARQPDSITARSAALRGAWLCGWALNVSTMGLHHKLCHVLGGLFDLPHAPLHAALLPYVTEFNADWARPAIDRLTAALGATTLWDLNTSLGTATALRDIGLPEASIDIAVTATLAQAPLTNPRPVDEPALSRLLRDAWHGQRPR
ncbi:MAG TPA: maleylacetate reductase [Pseudonocardiaceae bacterium]|jgi:maleylacetate reductase|nr:maleylacetate reductase [Pseudonocardiaceae bacterium]